MRLLLVRRVEQERISLDAIEPSSLPILQLVEVSEMSALEGVIVGHMVTVKAVRTAEIHKQTGGALQRDKTLSFLCVFSKERWER